MMEQQALFEQQLRMHCLEMAVRTPGVNQQEDVLTAAKLYHSFVTQQEPQKGGA